MKKNTELKSPNHTRVLVVREREKERGQWGVNKDLKVYVEKGGFTFKTRT